MRPTTGSPGPSISHLAQALDAVAAARCALRTASPSAWRGSGSSAFVTSREQDLRSADSVLAAAHDAYAAAVALQRSRMELAAALGGAGVG